ncbi:hypothetical protein [Melittangium boletus]|uniref:Lipoprotein n=1 Tax=Melittangium boletus DSM 14713 TaxID=1294270 RepID=A0A250IHH8_9BACT|nr:hypothetical protein [Melittangium boletus]ATB30617.1 hypothetical protein MEBOL_004078 [Melittangium boletus DSM 14713]
MRFNLRHILPLALMTFGCGAETSFSEAPVEAAEIGVHQQSMLQVTACADCLSSTPGARFLTGFDREWIKGDVYHYSLRLQVGPGAHDVVVLHRVVREWLPWFPVPSSDAAFLVHGDAWDFRGAFMSSTLTSDSKDDSVAVYLAGKGVDVWGIDLRWTQVPAATQDFTFMKNWNLGTHAQDVGSGLSVARSMRLLTGSGGAPMHLLGWSRGAQVGYAYMNTEARLPKPQRNVSGFIPVDMAVKFGPEAAQQREWACTRAQMGEQFLAQGRYEGSLSGPGAGVTIMSVGEAAIAMPDVTAPAPLPALPFRDLGRAVGAATFSFLTDAANNVNPSVPFYHFAAGSFDASGSLTGLRYVGDRRFFDFLSSAHPYQSFTEMVEGDQLLCGKKNLPYDDFLKDVKVPVLYVGAEGGFGAYGVYAAKNLLGSQDVTALLVKNESGRPAEFGHADLWLADDAAKRVWEPIYNWMKRH